MSGAIKVRVANGRHRTVPTIAKHGDFAVHVSLGPVGADLLSVTHVPTGARIPVSFTDDDEGRRRAKRAAKAFAIVFADEDLFGVEEPNAGGGWLHPSDSIKRRSDALLRALGERP